LFIFGALGSVAGENWFSRKEDVVGFEVKWDKAADGSSPILFPIDFEFSWKIILV